MARIKQRAMVTGRRHPAAQNVLKRLSPQFPDTGEGRLWLAVIFLAVADVFDGYRTRSALEYLFASRIPAADLCGVESEWIHRVLKEEGITRTGIDQGAMWE